MKLTYVLNDTFFIPELHGLLILNVKKTREILKASLTPPLLIHVPVPTQESGQSCICVLGVSILPLSTIFLWDFGTIPTV
jgi:hypothetical protein